jgi:hypothetical protein
MTLVGALYGTGTVVEIRSAVYIMENTTHPPTHPPSPRSSADMIWGRGEAGNKKRGEKKEIEEKIEERPKSKVKLKFQELIKCKMGKIKGIEGA